MSQLNKSTSLKTQSSSESPYPSYQRSSASEFLALFNFGNEEHCRWFRSSELQYKQHVFIGDESKSTSLDTPARLKNAKKYKSSVSEIIRNAGNNEVFWTSNQFFYRKIIDMLALLSSNHIDIDTPGHRKLSDADAEIFFQRVMKAIKDSGIPAPTAIVKTGFGGLQLYWIYQDQVETRIGTRAIKKWGEIALEIVTRLEKELEDLGEGIVDRNCSMNPSTYLRFPGSYRIVSEPKKPGRVRQKKNESDVKFKDRAEKNQKSIDDYPRAKEEYALLSDPEKVKLDNIGSFKFRTVESFVGGDKYDFDELYDLLEISSKKTKELRKPSEIAPKKKKKKFGHNIKEWWFKTYTNVLRQGETKGIGKGQRNDFIYILFVSLINCKGLDQALIEISKINDKFGFSDTDLQSTIVSAKRKKYRYRKTTLAAFLDEKGFDSSYLFENDKTKLTTEQVKQKQVESAEKTNKKRSETTIKALQESVNLMLNNGEKISKAAVSRESGLGLNTVKRNWDNLCFEKRPIRSSPIWLLPPGEPLGSNRGYGSFFLNNNLSSLNDTEFINEKKYQGDG